MTATKNGGAPGQENTAARTLVTTTDDGLQSSTATRTSTMVQVAFSLAASGIPVFPCLPGEKAPITRNGFKDATTDVGCIQRWWSRTPDANLAIPTGAATFDVLDVDDRDKGSGWPALNRLKRGGLLSGPAAVVRTPSGGGHFYYLGTNQSSGRLPRHFLDFKSNGGYVLVPPSVVGGRRYEWLTPLSGRGERLDWDTVRALLEPARPSQPCSGPSGGGVDSLARWVASLQEGNRNGGLYWAACRAVEAGHRGDLRLLVEAAVQAGLTDVEAWRTVKSADRRIGGAA